MGDYTIRKFTSDDKQAATDIFNYFVENSYAAYPEKKVGPVFVEKLQEPVINDSFYVVKNSRQNIVGFGLLKRHHAYEVFSRAAELTCFILPEHGRKGLGSKLLTMLTGNAKKADVDTLLVHISSLNEGSILFHQKHGFMEFGRKNDKDFDVIWMQRFI